MEVSLFLSGGCEVTSSWKCSCLKKSSYEDTSVLSVILPFLSTDDPFRISFPGACFLEGAHLTSSLLPSISFSFHKPWNPFQCFSCRLLYSSSACETMYQRPYSSIYVSHNLAFTYISSLIIPSAVSQAYSPASSPSLGWTELLEILSSNHVWENSSSPPLWRFQTWSLLRFLSPSALAVFL